MKFLKILFVILFFLLIRPDVSFGQDTSHFNVQENFKREIVIKDKRFRVYNNWFSGGGGFGFNTAIPYLQTIISVNMNFHVHQYYFRIGGMMSGDDFGLWNNYQLHAGWIPYRKETEKYNLAFVGAISYSTGYKFLYSPHVYENNHPYAEVGIYTEMQFIKKILYDAGIGGAFFINVNAKNTIVGLRADIYLSGAYKGYVKGREPQKMQ
ncbi:hypothetical protein BH09BAC5_BH09BAC5_21380 [soil metagenome]